MCDISYEDLTKPDLSIVVLSYNRLNDIKENLTYYCESFRKSEAEIIVVDNASTDGSREYLIKFSNKFNNLHVILNDTNLGVAQGRNKGYIRSTGKYILTLDDDSHIGRDEIFGLVNNIAENENAGIASPVVLHRKTNFRQSYHGEYICEIANFYGACYLIKREVIDSIGLLDEDCFFGGEELDYSMRARSAGYLTVYVPSIVALHNSFIRPGGERKERQVQWVFNYTRVLFKNLPPRFALVNSFRNLLSHVIHGSCRSGIRHGISIVHAAALGLRKGLAAHKPLSEEAVAFYRRSDIRPEFGNVPMVFKLLRCFNSNHAQPQ